ncbi:mannose-P-dolichol utilization defect 1 protein homolog [Rhopilema esculentum]|uniref:mannose-P-dolichol utilization defect 1 protein homolog n=1 Tax=Rhopilema esculentum TaxID=499914 RepID=UPI0031DD635E|eukprot:gene16185-7551_t
MANEAEYFFTPYALMLIPRKCHDEFFVKFNFLDVPCLKIALAKALGYGIVIGSAMVKIPQIVKVLQAKSVVGLSLLSILMEIISLLFSAAYSIDKGFPFSAWGESFLMGLQDVLLVVLYFYYSGQFRFTFLFVPAYAASFYVLGSGMTPLSVLEKLQACCIVMLTGSKLTQIVANFKNGHTGQLSAITVFLLLAGSLARIFTTIQETNDIAFLRQFIVACALNCILWGQILYYWNVKVDKPKKA